MAKIKAGFDIGSHSMKVAVAKGDGFRIETVRLPGSLTDENGAVMQNAFPSFLKEMQKGLHLPARDAALVLPSSQVICRLVSMPQMNREQLLLNLPYEFTDFVQEGLDQYFCDYAVCERLPTDEEGSMPIMAALAAKQQLEGYIRMFARGGVRLKKLVPREMALIELCRARRGGEFCFVDLGHQQTQITVILGDRVQATRLLPIGGRDLDRAIAEELGVDSFLANSYKVAGQQGVLETAEIWELCERLAVEILKVVNFYQFTYRATLPGVYLVGGGAAAEPLRRAIENTAGLTLLDPAELLNTSEGAATGGIFAAGAAMGGV